MRENRCPNEPGNQGAAWQHIELALRGCFRALMQSASAKKTGASLASTKLPPTTLTNHILFLKWRAELDQCHKTMGREVANPCVISIGSCMCGDAHGFEAKGPRRNTLHNFAPRPRPPNCPLYSWRPPAMKADGLPDSINRPPCPKGSARTRAAAAPSACRDSRSSAESGAGTICRRVCKFRRSR
jgi:hypothetical protein